MQYFAKKYLFPGDNLKILDVGSLDVNGTYKDIFQKPNWRYSGLDLAEGKNVDIVSRSAYDFDLPDNVFDVVVSGNCLEHVEAPWLWIDEVEKAVKPGGLICIIVPFYVGPHRYPLDCWRILPDGMRYLLKKSGNLEIIECFQNKLKPGDVWGIAKKSP